MEKRQKMENQKVGYTTKDWMLRFVKGMFIGSGFILPGVSGGALAAVFGMYERLISFLAHITKNFKENVLFFLPVGLGGVTGIFFQMAQQFCLVDLIHPILLHHPLL